MICNCLSVNARVIGCTGCSVGNFCSFKNTTASSRESLYPVSTRLFRARCFSNFGIMAYMRIDNPCKAFFYCDNDVVFHILSWLAVKTLDLRLFLAPLSILHCARVRIASERRTAATKALGRYRTATACDPIERVHPSVSLPKRWLRLLLREIHKRDRSAENPERRFPTVFYVLSVFSSRSGEGFVLSDVPL